MALWLCDECGTRFAVGAEKCPHCGSGKHHEDGTPKPRKPKAAKPQSKGT